jgi:hypothetical protein
MCYKSPGPRCSAHARTAFIKAKIAVSLANRSKSTVPFEDRFKLNKALKEAEMEFFMTPAGFRELERKISVGDNEEGNAFLLETCKASRAERLAAIKTKDVGDVPHKIDYKDGLGKNRDLLPLSKPDEKELNGWALRDDVDDITNSYVEASARWADKLKPNEVAAVRWITSNGFNEMDKVARGEELPYYHQDPDDITQEQKVEQVLKMKNLLNQALSKVDDNPKIVYRGVTKNSLPEEIRYYDIDSSGWGGTKKKRFNSDEEYQQTLTGYLNKIVSEDTFITFDRPVSTSGNPGVAAGFSDMDNYGAESIMYEISTRKGGAAGALSAWSTSEAEYVIPGQHKYKIVGVKRDCTVYNEGSRGVIDDTVTIIQLIDAD